MLRIALMRYRILALAVLVASVAAVAFYSSRLPTSYTATTVVSVEPRADSTASAALVALLATRYVAFAASDQMHQDLAEEFGRDVATMDSGLTVSMPERTTNITVSMTAEERTLVVDVANTLGERIVERAASDRTLEAATVVPAAASNVSESSGRRRMMLVGLILSAGFAVLVALVAELVSRALRRRPKSSVTPHLR